jgi:hypothetical protein
VPGVIGSLAGGELKDLKVQRLSGGFQEVLAMTSERRHEMGPGGYCICPKCNKKAPHVRGTPCQEQRCPHCGVKMLREDSYHHRLSQQKSKKKKTQ